MFKTKLIFVIIISFIILFSILAVSDFQLLNTLNNPVSKSNNQFNAKSPSKTLTNEKVTSTPSQIRQYIGLQPLLNLGYNGSNVIIGIIDTGINGAGYPAEFESRVIAQQSFVTVANGYGADDLSTTDTYGHGTEVASVAAGTTYGMAPAAKLVAGKILTTGITGNDGYSGEETSRGVVNAILYCVQQNATIINLSLGQYTNLVNDGRQYIIDKMSREHNVIFTISAANEGDAGIDGGSIGTPGTSFQAITVAASYANIGMASFSSSGIRVDYTVKPDVTAPGVGIQAVSGGGDGTSFSAPIVAGGIAVLIDALAHNGTKYSVGAIKAALLETAKPFPSTGVWYQGAGMVNFTAAYELLTGKQIDATSKIPIINTAFPKQLPISPLDTMFIDQTLPFNLTVVSSLYDSATISLHGIPNEAMSFNTFQYFNGSERLSLLFHPTKDMLPGFYKGYLLLSFSLNQEVNVSIEFKLQRPLIKVLFDETRNGLINDKKPLSHNNGPGDFVDPWGDSAFLLGQYREFYSLMALNSISVTPFDSGSYTNITYLQNFDVIVFPYPNSKVTDPFTDWYNDPTYGGNFNLSEPTLLFSQNELTTLNSYVTDFSKGILILTSDQLFTNTTAFNSLLDAFNIGYHLSNPSVKIELQPYFINSSHDIFSNVSQIDYYGTTFTPINTNPNTQAFEGGKFLILDSALYSAIKGRIIVSGSAYFAENYMLDSSSNSNFVNNCKFIINMVAWLSQSPYYQQTTTVTATTTVTTTITSSTTPSQSCNYTPSFKSNSSDSKQNNSSNLSANTSFFFAGLIMLPVIAIIARKRRNL